MRHRIFVAAFVASQLLIPLSYYTLRSDRHDERFAWRMFSTERMAQCKIEFKVDGMVEPTARRFHEAWIGIARRGRQVVIEHMAQRICDDNPGKEVRVIGVCRGPDRVERTVSNGQWNFCNVGRL